MRRNPSLGDTGESRRILSERFERKKIFQRNCPSKFGAVIS